MPWIEGYSVMKTAPVNKIIPFSNVDGPSNRMAIFFQGCQFNCRFCHNPETIHMCNNCGDCIRTCPVSALSLKDGKVVWDKDVCVNCDTCIKTCSHNASPKISWMSVDELMEQIQRVAPYIAGITLSGGECTIRRDFIVDLFPKVKAMGLTTLLDSNGSFDFEADPAILEYCDGVMLDVKAWDNNVYHRLTKAQDNEIVKQNFVWLLEQDKLTEVRIVCVPGWVDVENVLRHIATSFDSIGKYVPVRLLRFRPHGVVGELANALMPTDDQMEQYAAVARSLNLTFTIK